MKRIVTITAVHDRMKPIMALRKKFGIDLKTASDFIPPIGSHLLPVKIDHIIIQPAVYMGDNSYTYQWEEFKKCLGSDVEYTEEIVRTPEEQIRYEHDLAYETKQEEARQWWDTLTPEQQQYAHMMTAVMG